MERFCPAAIVSTGYAGGLARHLRPGAVVMYSRVWGSEGSPESRDLALLEPVPSDPGLAALAAGLPLAVDMGLSQGDGITVIAPAGDKEAKGRLADACGALAVDMESYWISRVAREAGIPSITLRAIIDPYEQALPGMVSLVNPDGTRKTGRAALSLLARPRSWGAVQALSRGIRVARLNLHRLLEGYIAAVYERSDGQ
jgi:hypothetical protein